MASEIHAESLGHATLPGDPPRERVSSGSRIRSLYVSVVRCSLGPILMWSAVQHMKNPYYFLASVLKYQIVADEAARIVVTILPTIEVIVGIFLLANLAPRLSLGVCSVLFLIFTIVQASALARGLQISCGCFGPVYSQEITLLSLGMIFLLMVLASLAFLATRSTASGSA